MSEDMEIPRNGGGTTEDRRDIIRPEAAFLSRDARVGGYRMPAQSSRMQLFQPAS